MQNLPLRKRLLAASRMARNAHTQFSLWRGLSSVDAHKAHRSVLNEYWEHLRFTKQAHLVASLVELNSLISKHRLTINLPNLLLELGKSGFDVSEPQKMLSRVQGEAKKVETLRNNALAHRSKQQEYDDVFRAAAITPDEIRELIDTAVEIVSLSLSVLDEDRPITSELPSQSLDRMLTALRRQDL